jgi:hypothetical protein
MEDPMSTIRVLLASAVLACATTPAPATAQQTDAEFRKLAESIFKLFDEGKYAEMYAYFHSSLKAQATEAEWVKNSRGVRQRTGRNLERRFKDKTTSFGQQVIRFDSRYEGGQAYDEVYVIEEDGRLTVSGIWVKPVAQ